MSACVFLFQVIQPRCKAKTRLPAILGTLKLKWGHFFGCFSHADKVPIDLFLAPS